MKALLPLAHRRDDMKHLITMFTGCLSSHNNTVCSFSNLNNWVDLYQIVHAADCNHKSRVSPFSKK